jgi:formylglycine-generating enzyme required for sulfatase activity
VRRTFAIVPLVAASTLAFLAKAAPPPTSTSTSTSTSPSTSPPPPPTPCPADARLVEHDHYEIIDRVCTDKRDAKHCFAYQPGSNRPRGKPQHLRFCMDVYEAPNVRGAKPLVMQSSVDAAAWCKARGKRMCNEVEFESACEGPEMLPWPYGWKADGEACNSHKPWREFHAEVLYKGGPAADAELERLWQGEPSGSRARCVTREGIFDLVGNVEEWVSSRPSRTWVPVTLIGGFWSKPWTGCRGANDAHEPAFRFYETGFRCCQDPG